MRKYLGYLRGPLPVTHTDEKQGYCRLIYTRPADFKGILIFQLSPGTVASGTKPANQRYDIWQRISYTVSTMNSKYVLTGGPGAGKTTLLNRLAARGYRVVPESARQIIRARLSLELPPRPEPTSFANEILRKDIAQYRRYNAGGDGPVFYDRGVLDALYMLDATPALSRTSISSYVGEFDYNRLVFLLPPWRDIYCTDSERDQTFEEASTVFEGMKRWYTLWGYRAVEVPRIDVGRRCDFILDAVKQASGGLQR
ncbi:AAA family ATPase [Microbulbifer halophilus]|uniref:AAA family ATPase n=1 Tax=Microbulbifer halophilus TaxID=453963 RepID=A0ABW5EFR0_9GAMM|nr:AAA family ATPase [Microbulbifer halophilus]MCW8128565.1 AAA family ATPase [Microbulbifer halophilus]